MKLFKYALLLIALMWFASVASASVSTSVTGTKIGTNFVTGYDVTCTATSTKTNGAYMTFHWWLQGSSTYYDKTVSKNNNKYVCTLPANEFIYIGNWHVSCQEYTSAMVSIPGQANQAQFTAVNDGGTVTISVNPATYDYGDSVTATATVSGTTPVTFKWYRPDETTPIRIYTDSTGPYTDTYTDANAVGTWTVTATQSVFTSSPEASFSVSADDEGVNTFLITGEISPIGSFILTEDITAEVTSADNDGDSDDGVKMDFYWYSPASSSTPVRTNTIYKNAEGKYIDTLPGGTSAISGSWHVDVYEYNAANSVISTGTEEFNTEESYTITGTQIGSDFVTGYDVTCSIYSPDIGGSYMIFEWKSPSGGDPIEFKIYENDYYFICTLPASYFNTPGQWEIVGTEYGSSGNYMDTVKPVFTAINGGSVAGISLSGTPDTSTYGASITATAEATTNLPVTFRWYRPDDLTNPIRVYTVSTPSSSSGSSYFYSDSYNDADVVGSWTVTATQGIASPSSESFTINPPSSGYTYLISGVKSASGAFIIDEPVTATVTSPYTDDGEYMKFYWYSPSDQEARFNTVYKIDEKYTDTLSAIQFDSIGSWHVHVYEYDNTGNLIGGGSQEEFEATDEGVPEFPIIGSFLPMLLAGAVYFKLRKNMEGS